MIRQRRKEKCSRGMEAKTVFLITSILRHRQTSMHASRKKARSGVTKMKMTFKKNNVPLTLTIN
jgi:hypothetical protein